ncbi:hypothetical protein SAY86_023633 [Trapa natans]|uniref:Uncharacterized protein n=1 Tax=Trapa natans TaxID=22666 RepID=A0AAN7LQ97_TRANT|nr:hypothetical protein SAY86_023633 [Trapa natans]
MEVEDRRKSYELKRLGFVRVVAIHALVCVSNLYDYAKRNSGPLRSTVGVVEGAVTAVAGPVYEKFKGVPFDALVFIDQKLDGASHKFDEHAPLTAKKIMCLAHDMIEIISQKTQKLVQEARDGGTGGAIHYVAAELKQLLLIQSMNVWGSTRSLRCTQCQRWPSPQQSAGPRSTIEQSRRWPEKGTPFSGTCPLYLWPRYAGRSSRARRRRKMDTAVPLMSQALSLIDKVCSSQLPWSHLSIKLHHAWVI